MSVLEVKYFHVDSYFETLRGVVTISTKPPLSEGALYTDFYQLTMAQTYFDQGLHETRARFEHFFRDYPDYGEHRAGYCVNAGLNSFLDWLERARFGEAELDRLRRHTGQNDDPLFSDEFLDWLGGRNPYEELKIEAIPEGRVVHPNEPLTVVEGPLALAQLIETSLLNHINYQILIATRAARINQAGEANLLLEFGLRRAHGKGGNSGARAALIGGADFSSNTGASYELGFEPKGTHAHSLVQAHLALGRSEREAFRSFAESYPDSCILLVDTIDTLESGLPNAIEVFHELRERGHEPVGIRLDSGDLAHLAVRSARILNDAGFPGVSIVLSNQIDEQVLTQILQQIRNEAPDYDLDPEAVIDRLVYGVGTRLITSAGDSSLGGVYKLVALADNGDWQPVLKVSETPEKVPIPGRKKLWRVYDSRGRATADLMTLARENVRPESEMMLQHPYRDQTSRRLAAAEVSEVEPLLVTRLENGERTGREETIEDFRQRRKRDLRRLDAGVKRILNPHFYHVSVSPDLCELKRELLKETL